MKKVYQQLAQSVQAYHNCLQSSNSTWQDKHEQNIKQICHELMPSGSGFDSGTTLDLAKSNGEKLVFNTSYHHMNKNGMYDGWTEHQVIVTPSFDGFSLRITGKDKNDFKEYAHDVFYNALETSIVWDDTKACYIPTN